ncbi:MAG: hypothetical protein ACXQTI_10660 [Candidatus Nezhaarchaeales archaeon]
MIAEAKEYSDIKQELKQMYIRLVDNEHKILPIVYRWLKSQGKIYRHWFNYLNKKFLLLVFAVALCGFPITVHNIRYMIDEVANWKYTRIDANIAIKLNMYASYGILKYEKAIKRIKVYSMNEELLEMIKSVIV